MNTGDRIKQRRIELGLTVDELAEKIGKSRATIYRYENGDIENMPTPILEPLAKALETTPADLMGWSEEKHYTNLASQYYDAVMHWSAEKGMSEEQTTAIRDHFAELLLRYKTLLEHYFQTNLNWKRERDAYIEFYSHGANKKSEVEIEELYLKDALKEQLKNLETWINTFPLKISMCKSESIEILNAAHARTDINIPEGVDTSENDIMDDKNF